MVFDMFLMLQPGTGDTSLVMRCGIVETMSHKLLTVQTAKPSRPDPEEVLGSALMSSPPASSTVKAKVR